ncbi:diguanylate cyclase domain-containing protein [Pseudomonas aeruginosa]
MCVTQKDRLDDSRSNLYADQLNRGFRGLRFLPELERDYRRYMLEDSFALKRIALSVGMLVWLAFIGIDLLILAGPPLWGVLAVRLGVLVLLLVCGCLIMLRRHIQLMVPLSIACVLALGVGAAAVVGLAHRADPGYPYEGLLLVSFAAYFLAGLRLSQALSCALVVLLAYLGFEWWAGTQEQLGNNLLFLLFGNLIGAVGCYLLEFKSREHFLISRLLRVMADHDSLTGLHNRRSFNQHLDRLWRQAQREQKTLALLLCDVDHFKAYNDRYGHQAGDAVLQRIGAVFEANARRPLDMAVRLGGEEFALLLYGANEHEARLRAEALRAQVQALRMEHEASDTAREVTLSVGVSCLWPTPGNDLKRLYDLYEHADRALYEAKAFGRNQVVA